MTRRIPGKIDSAGLALACASINCEHQLARQSAESAVQHAIRCGQMLADVKAALKHGEFGPWVKANCEFSPQTARVYMKAAAQNASGLAFSSLRQLFPSGQIGAERQHQREPEPLPADWLPPFGSCALACISEGVMLARESPTHPGFFDVARFWLRDEGGGSVDYLRRPAALRRLPGFPLVRLFDHELHLLAWRYTAEALSDIWQIALRSAP